MIAAEQALASAKLAEEVIGLREKVFELRNRLALDSPQIQARLFEVDLSILERMTPEFLVAIPSEMDYFSIVELQKECLQTLGSIERIVAEDVASQKAPFQELDLSFKAAAEKVSTPPKVVSIAEEKLSQLDHAIESGNISRILSLVSEVSRRKRSNRGTGTSKVVGADGRVQRLLRPCYSTTWRRRRSTETGLGISCRP